MQKNIYNLIFHRFPESFVKNPGKLKDLVRHTLDDSIAGNVSFGQDSTASITYIVKDAENNPCFSFDIALIYQPKKAKALCRLIHDKQNNTFVWNEIRDSSDVKEKAAWIKRQKKRIPDKKKQQSPNRGEKILIYRVYRSCERGLPAASV